MTSAYLPAKYPSRCFSSVLFPSPALEVSPRRLGVCGPRLLSASASGRCEFHCQVGSQASAGLLNRPCHVSNVAAAATPAATSVVDTAAVDFWLAVACCQRLVDWPCGASGYPRCWRRPVEGRDGWGGPSVGDARYQLRVLATSGSRITAATTSRGGASPAYKRRGDATAVPTSSATVFAKLPKLRILMALEAISPELDALIMGERELHTLLRMVRALGRRGALRDMAPHSAHGRRPKAIDWCGSSPASALTRRSRTSARRSTMTSTRRLSRLLVGCRSAWTRAGQRCSNSCPATPTARSRPWLRTWASRTLG